MSSNGAMTDMLSTIIEKVEKLNPVHGKKLRDNLAGCDCAYLSHVERFLKKFSRYLRSLNKDIDFAVDCYLKVVSDMLYEQIRFLQTGEYSCTTFSDAYHRVYGNSEVMEYHTQGLLLSQILWKQHYAMMSFFTQRLPDYKDSVKRYLEIGAGHGLYASEAIRALGNDIHVDVLDISPTAIALAKHFIDDDSVCYVEKDIFSFQPDLPYDFITMGEVLEHVENPRFLLLKARELLHDRGVMYITVPANAPAIDHIFLFNTIADIRDIIVQSEFTIINETSSCSENMPSGKAEKLKVPMMYGAFIKKTLQT
jgi:2-polyprenyl-3-methyl-5-hydroxy-6-metoxy-1,4-benzoquinol methylase